MNQKLKAKKRTETGKKNRELRNSGFIPGVVYGKKLPSIMISVSLGDFENVFKITGENSLIDLEIEGDKSHTVLIQEIAVHPVKE